MRDLLIVCPQVRDVKAIGEAAVGSRYRIHVVGPDLDSVESFDAEAIVEQCLEPPADAVIGTKDRSALIASLVAARRGLPSPTTRALANCQHKPTSRAIQRSVAPGSTPRSKLLEASGADPQLGFPLFAKPVIGRLSQYASVVEKQSDLLHLPELDGYSRAWADIVRLGGLSVEPVEGFLVEELLSGLEITFEGYVYDGEMTTIGVTDSQKYEGTPSFERFEYPSSLPQARLDELDDIAARVMSAIGFDNGFFNMEFYVPDEGPAQIIEANGRIASQFAPLVEACHGRSTYDALFELACGDDPKWEGGRPDGVAMSYCLRVFEDAFVESVPEPEEGLEILVKTGKRLSEQGTNDPQSFRLAIFSETGTDRAEVLARCRERAGNLAFELSPV
jgi:biotin carboxylase